MNNDLVLREHLAIERTKLANERTLLTYIRTGLYFLVAGSTLGHLVESAFWNLMGTPLMAVSVVIIVFGFIRFYQIRKKIEATKKQIGQASIEFVRTVRGDEDDA